MFQPNKAKGGTSISRASVSALRARVRGPCLRACVCMREVLPRAIARRLAVDVASSRHPSSDPLARSLVRYRWARRGTGCTGEMSYETSKSRRGAGERDRACRLAARRSPNFLPFPPHLIHPGRVAGRKDTSATSVPRGLAREPYALTPVRHSLPSPEFEAFEAFSCHVPCVTQDDIPCRMHG